MSKHEYAGLDAMTTAFLDAALWTASCNGTATHEGCHGTDCDASLHDLGWRAGDLPTFTIECFRSVCRDFLTLCHTYRADVLDGLEMDQVGHDFLLTAQGHGTGFWDRGLGDRGDQLTRWAQTYHFESPYIGDDGYPHMDY